MTQNNSNGVNNGDARVEVTSDVPASNRSDCKSAMKVAEKAMTKVVKSFWRRKTLEKRVPIFKWLPHYSWSILLSDLLAGLTVGLTAIPQGIAYAVVAGLEPQYGLYSGFMGVFVYMFLGSAKDVTIGPTAIMALLTQKAVASYNSDMAVLLTFLSGCIILLLGILQLGILVDFISMPVVVGFTTASAITIACSQLKPLLGIKGKSNEFLDTWIEVADHIEETRYQDLILGLCTIIALLLIKFLNDHVQKKLKTVENISTKVKVVKETLRYFNLARNAVVVIIGTALAYVLSLNDLHPFVLTGNITGGLPPFQPPPFSTVGNDNETVTFSDMFTALGANAISLPLIAILESIAIAKAFSKGKSLDATQEMLALGVANIVGSFVRSMPTTGSFTRTAVNHASGVRTPMGGLFTGALVLSALSLTGTFYFIPKATLAGLIITAMFYMIEYQEIQVIWRTKKIDIIPLFTTILGCLFLGLDYGILIGIAVNLIYVLYNVARPNLTNEETKVCDQEILLVRPEQNLIYPSAEFVRNSIMKSCIAKDNKDAMLVIDGRNVHNIDATVAKNIRILTDDLNAREQEVVLWNWKKNPKNTCLGLDIGLEKYFSDEETVDKIVQMKNSARPQ